MLSSYSVKIRHCRWKRRRKTKGVEGGGGRGEVMERRIGMQIEGRHKEGERETADLDRRAEKEA